MVGVSDPLALAAIASLRNIATTAASASESMIRYNQAVAEQRARLLAPNVRRAKVKAGRKARLLNQRLAKQRRKGSARG